jgi:hypothetical protein
MTESLEDAQVGQGVVGGVYTATGKEERISIVR